MRTKAKNHSIGSIYEELSSNIMKKFTGNSTIWNMSKPILFDIKKLIVEELERVQLYIENNDVPLDIEKIDEQDFKFIYDLFFLAFTD